LWDRKVIGWALSHTMTAKDTSIAALKMALQNRPLKYKENLLFHSDRGIQYACEEFTSEVNKGKNIDRSMSRKGNCWDNTVAESFFKTLKTELSEHDIKMGRDKFFDLLRENKLLIKPKRFRTKTTCSFHHFNKFEYLIKDLTPKRSNEIWASDITYLWLKKLDKFCYLSMITDLYSRKIVGYCVHDDLSVNGCIDALKMALKQRTNKTENLIHHSDRGVQYCSHAYVKLLQKNNIQISMTQTGDPLENAVAERINKTIKEEFTNDRQINFTNMVEAKTEIKKFIEFYNNKRPHRSIEWLTPTLAHQHQGELKRVWKSYPYKRKVWEDLVEA
jgi:transposase InsO family protein